MLDYEKEAIIQEDFNSMVDYVKCHLYVIASMIKIHEENTWKEIFDCAADEVVWELTKDSS